MNMDEFLRLRGADVAAVVAKVAETVGLEAGDTLLAVGSIVEGLGNSKSDLDLFLITPRAEGAMPAHDSVVLVVGKCLIDLRALRSTEYGDLFSRFESWSRAPWNVTQAVKFTLDERTLLHRVLHGVPLYSGHGDRVAMPIPQSISLARLKFHVARQMARTIQVDLVGYRENRDYRSLGFAAQEVLGHAADALCAGYKMTNPLTKWRSRMLERVPFDWENALTMRPTGLTAGELVWNLHRAPAQPDEKLSLEHALRIVAFARAVFLWAELNLVNDSVAKPELNDWPQSTRQGPEPILPHLQFDVDFFLVDGRVTVARLNEFGEALDVLPREFALVLLCDGTTTVHEAEMVVYGHRTEGARHIDHLLSEVARAGLAFHPVSG
ncbi:hypothetical protein [Rhodopseudomonas palustris]|uniref:Polymerase nucleotidyl transferase domain-containing protein n=1 Tax=Rhodopseudomonas palustris (strain BisB18) TaxID=316056 RepID=Q20ZM4_RHOPB